MVKFEACQWVRVGKKYKVFQQLKVEISAQATFYNLKLAIMIALVLVCFT
jgi:hypothetical protein